ncbi:putative dehydrogenase [Parelusimicrobium proximum]|uniref:Gfo/Idh/MocA family protein n=1 Tax=Parelusimicrobium proximum TaxID=3228953 RepID=UPI003D1760AC
MKILIAGLGSIAKKHIAAIRAAEPDAEIYALRSSANSAEYEGVKSVYSDAEARRLNVDFIIISVPTANHTEYIERFIPFAVPLFIEKPLADNIDIKPLLEKVRTSGIRTYIACNLRFLECIKYLKDNLAGKRINEVNIYCGSYLPDWRKGVDFRQIYSADRSKGGGADLDLIHEIDYMHWLFGRPERSVSVKSSVSSLNIKAPDFAGYIFSYKDFNVSVTLNYYRRDAKRTCEIVCEDGTYTADLLQNTVYFRGQEIFSSENTMADTYTAQMKYFIGSVRSGKEMDNDIFEGYEVLTEALDNVKK